MDNGADTGEACSILDMDGDEVRDGLLSPECGEDEEE